MYDILYVFNVPLLAGKSDGSSNVFTVYPIYLSRKQKETPICVR